MIKLSDLMSKEKLEKLIAEGYIYRRPHPSAPLFILNYTPKCQYDWLWTKETIQCRGLIVDEKDQVIARPWPKFFTTTQYADLRNKVHNLYGVKYKEMYGGPFSVTEKMDGFMSILYWIGNEPGIATRGSFESPQAIAATKIFREKYADRWRRTIGIDPGVTYVFEGILPAYRIVVDYDGMEALILLSRLDNESGKEYKNLNDIKYRHTFPMVVTEFVAFQKFNDILKVDRQNKEGFVVHFHDSGVRVKVKHTEYLRLHKIMTGCTKRKIWEMLRNNEDPKTLQDVVPDEFYNWIDRTTDELNEQFCDLKTHAILEAQYLLSKNISRKSMALELRDNPHSGRIFGVLDDKQDSDKFNDAIWMSIRPPASTPWTQEQQK